MLEVTGAYDGWNELQTVASCVKNLLEYLHVAAIT